MVRFRTLVMPRRGMTIIELVVVVAMITVLVGLMVPALSGVRERGRSLQCMNHLRTIGVAATLYQAVEKDHYPLSSHAAGSVVADGAWLQSLAARGVTEEMRTCPSDPFADLRFTSYATNDHFEPLVAGIDYDPVSRERLPGGRTRSYARSTDIPSPSKTVYAAEVLGDGTIDHLHSVGWSAPSEIEDVVAVTRHGDHANYLFADLHVEPLNWEHIALTFTAETSFFNPATAR